MSEMSFKKLRMPKHLSEPSKGEFLDNKFITQFFEEIDDQLIYNADYGKNTLEVVSYKKEGSWRIVHPSATETIKFMDIQYKLGIYIIRDIVKVPNDLVNVSQYWVMK
jgi:hypothetical protein